MKDIYKLPAAPRAKTANIIQGDTYRITLLTDRLVRMEYSADGIFEDRATQTVLNRDFEPVKYDLKDGEELAITTDHLRIWYGKGEFSSRDLIIQTYGEVNGNHSTWHFGQPTRDLRGTARTLDEVDGACELGHGLMSRDGYSVLDDSLTLVITEDGWVEPRKKGIQDFYFFGYGHDYFGCLKDFYRLCGKTPMLPRYALGNWWSRYYEYTEESYLELMKRFDEEGIPFSVAVIDMDWHLVNIEAKYGSGWTGYTWNRELFPDPRRFMEHLHERGMRITLNVHPADGVRAHEEMYQAMAEELGVDIRKEQPISFDIADPTFLEAYFKYLHHPNEEQGVDFWWLDWQQGGVTKIEGLDPLWMLNHFHFLDSARDGKRPMTFSRYAGPGSHRYPVGFSGDSYVTWESLEFQPYFTANASNIGYGWWSHDIGGHMHGYKNDELAGRWFQLGVFSPVNRLHSTKNEFNGKEPWRYNTEIRNMMDDFLRLRHRLLPYLYTMNYRAWKEDKPLVVPMYYGHPEEAAAYDVPNEYYFGSELIVAPVTSKRIEGINMAKVRVWIPEGNYIDFFTGVSYQGGRTMDMYRDIRTLPVLAAEGAIIPMTEKIQAADVSSNPEELTLKIFAGADSSFTLYEDDNTTCAYEKDICARTEFVFSWEGSQGLTVNPAEGKLDLIPAARTYKVEFIGLKENKVNVIAGGRGVNVRTEYDSVKHCLSVQLPALPVDEQIDISFVKAAEKAENDRVNAVYRFLDQAEIEFDTKDRIYQLAASGKDRWVQISQLQATDLPEDTVKAICEILTA